MMSDNQISSLEDANDDNTTYLELKSLVLPGKVVGVHDGDTLKLVVRFLGRITKFNCRMFGYDSPELKDKENDASWIAINALLRETTDILGVDLEKKLTKQEISQLMYSNRKIIAVHFLGKDKYGRELIKLHDSLGCINDRMISNYNFNVAYFGKGARPVHEKYIKGVPVHSTEDGYPGESPRLY